MKSGFYARLHVFIISRLSQRRARKHRREEIGNLKRKKGRKEGKKERKLVDVEDLMRNREKERVKERERARERERKRERDNYVAGVN